MGQPSIHEFGEESKISSLSKRVSRRVRELRKAANLTLQQLSDLTHGAIAYQHLSSLEISKKEWRLAHLEAVAAALGLRPRDLLPDDDAPSSADPVPARTNPAPVAPAPPETGAALAAAVGISEAELQLVMALRAPELRALLEAIGHLAHAANTDRKPPDDTRARLERLLEPNRMGRRPATRSPAVKPPK